jgi:acetoin utilization deacetylase AcuC-like enzyme
MPAVGCTGRLVYAPEYQRYDFGPAHPLRPERIRASLDLFASLGLGPVPNERYAPPAASRAELLLIHDARYLDAVQRLDAFAGEAELAHEAGRWGLGPGDSPAFAGMHEAAAMVAGGTLHAVTGVLQGDFQHAFNPAGGLHHALRDRTSGFCIYNDAAVAIAAAIQQYGARVLYLDFDAHHGDGVQAAFYDDPRVLTFSIHETGRHLFPGTGSSEELGRGLGRGYSLNLPVEPLTADASWLEGLELLVPALAEWFQPDLIVSQHGCDSHAWDPLSHLRLSTRGYAAQTRLVHQLAHQVAGGRWVALGGGGYDWIRVVPRSWAIVWCEMSGRDLPEQVSSAWATRWHEAAKREDFVPLPTHLLDESDGWPRPAREQVIARENRWRAEALRRLAVPAIVRHAAPGPVAVETTQAAQESRVVHLDTPRGRLLLRDRCPLSLIERLHPGPGLVAFVRKPEREFELLLRAAADPATSVTLAHTEHGAIVGFAVLSAGTDWWDALPGVYEVSLQTSRAWRRLGVGRALLQFSIEAQWIEDTILLAMGLDWHWDLVEAELDAAGYGSMLRTLLRSVGFREVTTSEPNVAMHELNFLLVRAGARVPAERRAALNEALVIAPWLRRNA